jgi:hypothetical protein
LKYGPGYHKVTKISVPLSASLSARTKAHFSGHAKSKE